MLDHHPAVQSSLLHFSSAQVRRRLPNLSWLTEEQPEVEQG